MKNDKKSKYSQFDSKKVNSVDTNENKRYFSIDYDEEYYIFDSTKISKEEVLEKAEYSYDVFGDSLMRNDVVNLLNENEQLKQQISEQAIQLDYLKDENRHMIEVLDENKQLKQHLHDFVQLANENDKALKKEYVEEIISLKSSNMELEDANARLEEKNIKLQERNDRQYDKLTHLWECIQNKDYETLQKEWEEIEEADKKLQEEWECL